MKPLAVIPSYVTTGGDLEVLMTCIETLLNSGADCDVLVVDDGSPDEGLLKELGSSGWSFEFLRKPKNEGFSKTVNVGLRRALNEGRDAVLVNADIEFPPTQGATWLERMSRQPTESGEGLASIVGARLLYPSGLIQHGGVFFSMLHRVFEHIYKYAPGDLPEAQHARRCPVTGALMFIRHECLAAIGVYDEEFLLGWEDVDYCIRAFQSGRECVYQPTAWAYHYESMFRGRPSPKLQDWQARSWIYFIGKHQRTSFSEFVPSL